MTERGGGEARAWIQKYLSIEYGDDQTVYLIHVDRLATLVRDYAREQVEAALRERERALPELIVRDVAELPDRTSPEDQPEMMMVTSEELLDIVRVALAPRRG